MSNRATATIAGPGRCAFCLLTETPEAERTDFLGSDGCVSCLSCRRVSSQIAPALSEIFGQPQSIRNVVARLVSVNFSDMQTPPPDLTVFELKQIEASDGAGAVATNNVFDVPTRIFLFNAESSVGVEIIQSVNRLKAMEAATAPGTSFADAAELPRAAAHACNALTGFGFQFVGHKPMELLRSSVVFCKGTRIHPASGAGDYTFGVQAVVQY